MFEVHTCTHLSLPLAGSVTRLTWKNSLIGDVGYQSVVSIIIHAPVDV